MRVFVLAHITPPNYAAANAFLVDVYGDDPGSQELSRDNATDGTNLSCVSCANLTAAEADSWQQFLGALSGCGSNRYAGAVDFWSEAANLWGVHQA